MGNTCNGAMRKFGIVVMLALAGGAWDAAAAGGAMAATRADASRSSPIATLLDRWEGIAAAKGWDAALWRETMRLQLELANPQTIARLLDVYPGAGPQALAQQYQAFIGVLGADIALRLQAADKGQSKALGDAGVDQTFIPITPCRIVDTRNVGGTIGPFATRNFYFYTTDGAFNWFTNQGGVYGGASTACPQTVFGYAPSAAVTTITVTGQGGAGNLIVWGGANPVASASTMSYGASGDIANLAVVPWGGRTTSGPGGPVLDFGVKVNSVFPANVVVDVVGYYTQPQATALDCVTVQGHVQVNHGGNFADVSSSCATGYTVTGGGCMWYNLDGSAASGNTVIQNRGARQYDAVNQVYLNGWSCRMTNNDSSIDYNIAVRTMCCRLPGR